jgi:hypothetical protein
MSYRKFLSIALFQILLFSEAKSQATIQLLLLDDSNNQPLETIIKWHSQKTNEDYYFKTDKNGKAAITIKGNDSYKTTVPYSLDEYTVAVPSDPNYHKDLVLRFEIEKTAPLPPVVEQPKVQPRVKINYQNLVGLQIFNRPLSKRLEIIEIESQNKVKTMERDTESFALPTERRYKLVMEGVEIQNNVMDLTTFSPKMVGFVLYFNADNSARLYPIVNATAVNLVQKNLIGEPVVGEKITIVGQKTGQKYEALTRENGSVLYIVPKDDSYEISLQYFPKIWTLNAQSSMSRDLTTFSYTITYPSSIEVDKRKKEAEKRIEERDSLYRTTKKKSELAVPEFTSKIGSEKDMMLKKVERDPHYFEKIHNAVCAVLYRFSTKWTEKVIVTDVTGSMYPYLEELALWNVLEFMKDEKNAYVFFNDGDNKPDYSKIMGKTGGIYGTQSNNTDTIIKYMHLAMKKGVGGDAPENNIEALLVSQKYAQSAAAEYIMVADNLSPIKDLMLLSYLKKPIHIILCGVDASTGIHPDYLWLAYKTRGSVHTVDEDTMNLGSMVEGKTVTIAGRNYQLLNNQFFEVK